LGDREAESIFQNGLKGNASTEETRQFIGHMILEMARMSLEDGLVMQLRAGPFRNHSPQICQTYGPDRGFDIPVRVEWTRNLKPLLDAYGLEPALRIILFSLDEDNYARELAPLAGAYPTIKLGPPWWFHDSPNGMLRYFTNVMETAGFENTVGFNDDTSALLSIPARHDLWRRMSALWLAGLVHRGQLDLPTAERRMADLAYHLAKQGYQLD
jgi:glucuronate isomerase